jgi:hypothetical protein
MFPESDELRYWKYVVRTMLLERQRHSRSIRKDIREAFVKTFAKHSSKTFAKHSSKTFVQMIPNNNHSIGIPLAIFE